MQCLQVPCVEQGRSPCQGQDKDLHILLKPTQRLSLCQIPPTPGSPCFSSLLEFKQTSSVHTLSLAATPEQVTDKKQCLD